MKTETGKILKKILKKRNLTQTQLSQRIGKTQGFLSRIINDCAGAKDSTLEDICKVLVLTNEEYFELWRARGVDSLNKIAKTYFLKLEKDFYNQNEELKKIKSENKKYKELFINIKNL